MNNIGCSIFGKGPQRRCYGYKKCYHTRPTEVHEALTSFGLRDRTGRLSDAEFYRQLGQEAEYLCSCVTKNSASVTKGLLGAVGSVCQTLDKVFAWVFD